MGRNVVSVNIVNIETVMITAALHIHLQANNIRSIATKSSGTQKLFKQQ